MRCRLFSDFTNPGNNKRLLQSSSELTRHCCLCVCVCVCACVCVCVYIHYISVLTQTNKHTHTNTREFDVHESVHRDAIVKMTNKMHYID
jgi:hypothetical protein